LVRNVRKVWQGGSRGRVKYRAAVDCATAIPNLRSSAVNQRSGDFSTTGKRCCLWLPKTPSELKMQWFRAFVRSWWYHDELSFCCPFRFGHLQFSIPCRPAGGDPRASSSTRGFPEECTAAFAPPALRPAFVGLAVTMVARPGWRRSLHIVRPDTVIAWHRRAFAWYWTRKSRRRPGRPNVPAEIRGLIRNMSHANPLWGAPRIHGELLKLGIAVAQ